MKYDSYWDYKEEVTRQLIRFGIYFRNAELAVIDMSIYLKEGMAEKRSPEDVAVIMYDKVKNTYREPEESINNANITHQIYVIRYDCSCC